MCLCLSSGEWRREPRPLPSSSRERGEALGPLLLFSREEKRALPSSKFWGVRAATCSLALREPCPLPPSPFQSLPPYSTERRTESSPLPLSSEGTEPCPLSSSSSERRSAILFTRERERTLRGENLALCLCPLLASSSRQRTREPCPLPASSLEGRRALPSSNYF